MKWPLLYAVAATFGIGQALNQPTRNLLVYHTVGRSLLHNGIALNSLTGNAMRVIGPTVGVGEVTLGELRALRRRG